MASAHSGANSTARATAVNATTAHTATIRPRAALVFLPSVCARSAS